MRSYSWTLYPMCSGSWCHFYVLLFGQTIVAARRIATVSAQCVVVTRFDSVNLLSESDHDQLQSLSSLSHS